MNEPTRYPITDRFLRADFAARPDHDHPADGDLLFVGDGHRHYHRTGAVRQHPRIEADRRFYIWVVRGTPLLVQLFVVFYGLPDIGIVLDPFPAAIIVFSINEGAYCAETMRAALEAVPAGQMEAGYCVGMSYLQIIRRIVLPQALRTAFPPLSNSLISMVKDTSLAANITVMEMFMATQRIAARTYEMLPLYCEVAAIYLLFSTILTFIQRAGERRLSSYGKRDGKRKA